MNKLSIDGFLPEDGRLPKDGRLMEDGRFIEDVSAPEDNPNSNGHVVKNISVSNHQDIARKQAIAKRFSKAAHVYDSNVQVQKQVSHKAYELLQSMVNQKQECTLDIGCGTGSDSHKLLNFSQQVIGADLSQGMICYAKDNNQHPNVDWLVADAEALPVKSGSVDNIYSSMALQWLAGAERVASECFRVVSNNGQGVIAVVLRGSLFELHDSWRKLDKSPPINHFMPAHKWLNAFEKIGFNANILEIPYITYHQNILAVLHSLKDVGAGVVLDRQRNNPMKKTKLKLLDELYRKDYLKEQGLPLTWKIGFLTFNKPD